MLIHAANHIIGNLMDDDHWASFFDVTATFWVHLSDVEVWPYFQAAHRVMEYVDSQFRTPRGSPAGSPAGSPSSLPSVTPPASPCSLATHPASPDSLSSISAPVSPVSCSSSASVASPSASTASPSAASSSSASSYIYLHSAPASPPYPVETLAREIHTFFHISSPVTDEDYVDHRERAEETWASLSYPTRLVFLRAAERALQYIEAIEEAGEIFSD